MILDFTQLKEGSTQKTQHHTENMDGLTPFKLRSRIIFYRNHTNVHDNRDNRDNCWPMVDYVCLTKLPICL